MLRRDKFVQQAKQKYGFVFFRRVHLLLTFHMSHGALPCGQTSRLADCRQNTPGRPGICAERQAQRRRVRTENKEGERLAQKHGEKTALETNLPADAPVLAIARAAALELSLQCIQREACIREQRGEVLGRGRSTSGGHASTTHFRE